MSGWSNCGPIDEAVARGACQAVAEGLATRYPGDVGIERDPRVILVENFEGGSLDALARRWETVSGRYAMSLSTERPEASAGKQSLLIDRGKGPAGQLYRRLRNPKGVWGTTGSTPAST